MDVLHAQALQARAAGEHERAIASWRALLRQHPDDWRLALELKRDLRAAWHYPDSDKQFRRAARRLPDAEWLQHYAALYAFHGNDLDALDARARAMLARAPADHRLLSIAGGVASQRRDWAAAAAAFAAAFAAEDREDYRFKRETAAMYERLAPLLRELSLPPALVRAAPQARGEREQRRYSVIFVNLDRNREREVELRRQFAGSGAPLHRSAGIEGRRLPASAVRRLGGDPQARGTLGCFLSHAGAWEAMLSRDEDWALIVEDDVIPLLDLPATLAGIELPPGCELLFVNDRIAPRLDPAGVTGFTTIPLAKAMAAFPPEDNAPGGDGYLLSRAGARKLLDWVDADGFGEDLDWRLIAYGLSPAAVAGLPRPGHAGPWLDRVSQVVRRPERLCAHVLHPPLIRTVGVSSDREDENRLHAGRQSPIAN